MPTTTSKTAAALAALFAGALAAPAQSAASPLLRKRDCLVAGDQIQKYPHIDHTEIVPMPYTLGAVVQSGNVIIFEQAHEIGTTVTVGASIELGFGDVFTGGLAAEYSVSESTSDATSVGQQVTCPPIDPPPADPLDNWSCDGVFSSDMVVAHGWTYDGVNGASPPPEYSDGCANKDDIFTIQSPHINGNTNTQTGRFDPCICPRADGKPFAQPLPQAVGLCPGPCLA